MMKNPTSDPALIRRIRFWLILFVVGLVLSGLTAFPLETELRGTLAVLQSPTLQPVAERTHLLPWITRVHHGVADTNSRYPFLAYGTDWLAFAHLVLAIAFIGPFRDPLRNQWVITFGLLACAAVLPLALIAGPVRGIPLPWRCIDCSFGLLGAVPLLICRGLTAQLEARHGPSTASIPPSRTS